MRQRYGYGYIKFTKDSLQLATQINAFKHAASIHRQSKELSKLQEQGKLTIAGNVKQHSLDPLFESKRVDEELFNRVVEHALKSVGIDLHANHRLLIAKKLLANTIKGTGRQAIHFDWLRGPQTPHTQRITILIYLTACLTSAMPTFTLDRIAGQPRKESVPFVTNRQYYHSIRAQPGDIMVCQQNVPHYGEVCDIDEGRYVAFCQCIEPCTEAEKKALAEEGVEDIGTDEYQYFYWQYVGDAMKFGASSYQYCEAVLQAHHDGYNPLGRALSEEAYNAICECLKDTIDAETEESYLHKIQGTDDMIPWEQLHPAK